MRFIYVIAIEVERTEGKFVSREEIGDGLLESLEGADPGSLYINESIYEVLSFEINEQEQPKRRKKAQP